METALKKAKVDVLCVGLVGMIRTKCFCFAFKYFTCRCNKNIFLFLKTDCLLLKDFWKLAVQSSQRKYFLRVYLERIFQFQVASKIKMMEILFNINSLPLSFHNLFVHLHLLIVAY